MLSRFALGQNSVLTLGDRLLLYEWVKTVALDELYMPTANDEPGSLPPVDNVMEAATAAAAAVAWCRAVAGSRSSLKLNRTVDGLFANQRSSSSLAKCQGWCSSLPGSGQAGCKSRRLFCK